MTDLDLTRRERDRQDADVNRVARLLMAEWERVEGKPVNVSYVATFADMARAVLRERDAEVDRLTRQVDAMKALADELVREMVANIPLSPPDRAHDPNDEFKRCAVDRAERTKRWREKVRAIIDTEKGADCG